MAEPVMHVFTTIKLRGNDQSAYSSILLHRGVYRGGGRVPLGGWLLLLKGKVQVVGAQVHLRYHCWSSGSPQVLPHAVLFSSVYRNIDNCTKWSEKSAHFQISFLRQI
jgi:hypothetical protein